MKLNPLIIGLRAQDFHDSLKVTTAFGPKEVYYEKTLLIGKAATLAMHLRGLRYINDYTQLKFAAASLGITSLELPLVLRELEEVNFVSVVSDGDVFRRLDVRVPEFRSGYYDLGERWLLLNPTEIEQASISVLDTLYTGPQRQESLLNAVGIGIPERSMLIDVMGSGLLLATQTINGEPIMYTPLAVDGNPTPYLHWAEKYPSEVSAVLETLKQNQGLSLSDPSVQGNNVLNDAIVTGVLMPITIHGANGAQRFVFAPKGGLKEEERIILDKARAALACVRYGQRFAAGAPIKYPHAILRQLRDEHRFKTPHPDLFTQYGLLAEKFIGHPVDEGNGYWNFEVDDTEENIKALDVAIDMLHFGDTPSAHIDIQAQKALLAPSGYQGPSATRPRLAKELSSSPETRAEIIKQIGGLIRGESTHG